ncbi:MAG: TatD family hydrolase [Desulfopila sp.]
MTQKKTKPPLPVLARTSANTTTNGAADTTYLIDTHCHLDMGAYSDDLEAILRNCFAHGVRSVITIGIDTESSHRAVHLAARFSMVRATVGIHPHDVGGINDADLREISALIERHSDKIVGYGEIGLDYVKKYSPAAVQKNSFSRQLDLAKEHDLPVIIHDREAHGDILDILKAHGPFDKGGVLHCFSGDLQYARQVLDLGFHISIPGIVTFKNATELKDVAANIPLDRLLLETDGPFLAPDPYRGKRNEPLYLLYTAAEIARLRGITLEQMARATTRNAMQLFTLDAAPPSAAEIDP